MAPSVLEEVQKEMSVGMGQALWGRQPVRLTAILGSCVAIALYASKHRMGMLSHIVLPRSTGETAYPAKFADTAVPHMIATLEHQSVKPRQLVAKIAGGACMFGNNSKIMDIGDSNVRTVMEALDAAGIPLVARETGGNVGRRICFDLSTGLLSIETTGRPTQTI